jgi:hypothetical protein
MTPARKKQRSARMAKLADAADLKSADPYRSWGFKSPSGHHRISRLNRVSRFPILWLLQQATRCSVKARRDRHSQSRCASFSPASPPKRPASTTSSFAAARWDSSVLTLRCINTHADTKHAFRPWRTRRRCRTSRPRMYWKRCALCGSHRQPGSLITRSWSSGRSKVYSRSDARARSRTMMQSGGVK